MALNVSLATKDKVAKITLEGELDASVANKFKETVEKAAAESPTRLVLFMNKLTFMASAGLRVLIFAKQKMGETVDVYVVGAQGPVLNTLQMSGFHHAVHIQDSYSD